MDELAILKRRFERERKARKEAERLLETKALALYYANENLQKLNEDLEKKVKDRTEELRRSEDKYRGIIEGMELGLLEVDLNHIIIKAYDWFKDMTGYTSEELEGKNALEILTRGEVGKIIQEQDKKRQRGQAGVYEAQIYRKDGVKIWVLISGAPIYNLEGEIIGSIGIHYDITERKRLEQDLTTAKKIAEEAQEAEKQFLARMSHEIRTPLNAVIGMAHLLYDTQPTKEQKDYIDTLKSSADILLQLISYILDISKIEAGEVKINKKEFDLPGLLFSMQKTFQLKVSKDINVLLDIDPKIQNILIGDDLLLNQVLLNLLGNADKFTKKGEIGIQVRQLKKEGAICLLEFTVFDTGIGIPEKNLEMIFMNFKQSENTVDHSIKGTGLGLAICKQLIELQEGTIRVESVEGKGTSFIFVLPYLDSEKVAVIGAVESSLPKFTASENEKILVVEDNFMNRKYLTTLLNKWNIQYDIAFNGAEAWKIAQEKKYNLILMDISMPIMNGYEATIKIRNQINENKQTPIVALTASAIMSQQHKSIEVGMNDFLPKPFHPKQLLDIIKKYLHHKTEIIEKEINLPENFQFNALLNREFLEHLYADDLDYAADMFDTFLDYTVGEFPKITDALLKEDLQSVQHTAHKLNPTFAMVGLTELKEKMLEIEHLALDSSNLEAIRTLNSSIQEELDNFIPILKADLEIMMAILNQ